MDNTPYTSLDKARFVVGLLPAITRVSEETGFSSDLMLAQAIQETGWGKSMQQGDAAGTFNLFGIKADQSWVGPTKSVVTHEFINGEKVEVIDKFRVYSSYDEALRDRVKFLEENPRYNKMLEVGTKGDFFKESKELQDAGYATDPNYTENLTALFQGKTLREALKIIADNSYATAHGFAEFTDPNIPYKSPADSNENRIPDILESKPNKLHTSQTQDIVNVDQKQAEAFRAMPTQDQIVTALILQNVRDAIRRGESLPSIQTLVPHTELS